MVVVDETVAVVLFCVTVISAVVLVVEFFVTAVIFQLVVPETTSPKLCEAVAY